MTPVTTGMGSMDLAGIVRRSELMTDDWLPREDRRALLALLRETRAELDFLVNDDLPDVKPDEMPTDEWDRLVTEWRTHKDAAMTLLAALAALDPATT